MKFIEINDEIINLAHVRKISKTSNINGRRVERDVSM